MEMGGLNHINLTIGEKVKEGKLLLRAHVSLQLNFL